MYRKEITNFRRGTKPEPEDMAVAYFLDAWNSETRAPEAGPLSLAEQREAVERDAKITGTTIAISYTDYETESDTNRPGLRALLDEARRRGITTCLVAGQDYVADNEGAVLFWNAMFKMAGMKLVVAKAQ